LRGAGTGEQHGSDSRALPSITHIRPKTLVRSD
jgi:hypothetical protein